VTEDNRKENIRFSKLMKFREEADYNPVSMFTEEDFLALKGEAETENIPLVNRFHLRPSLPDRRSRPGFP